MIHNGNVRVLVESCLSLLEHSMFLHSVETSKITVEKI